MPRPWLVSAALALSACAVTPPTEPQPSPYLIAFAGDDWDSGDEDFVAVFDMRTGQPISSTPVGLRKSMPHHFEYELPPAGQPLFANAHHAEEVLLLDFSNPHDIRVLQRLKPPAPYRFTHDFKRMPNGNVLVGFLRSEGPSPEAGDDTMPGGHGGIAEVTPDGRILRTASAAAEGLQHPVRPYALLPLPAFDRIVTTSAPMMEKSSADVIQIWSLSDFLLLHTIAVPAGQRSAGSALPAAADAPFALRELNDGSILMSTYGCAFYRLTGVDSDSPGMELVHTISPDAAEKERGSCGIPVLVGHWWLLPIGKERRLATFDVSDPTQIREVASLPLPKPFAPHWLASDPRSDRLVLGAELGGEEGMYVLRLDRDTGEVRVDQSVAGDSAKPGYLDFDRQSWPHGDTGKAWAHAALFLPGP